MIRGPWNVNRGRGIWLGNLQCDYGTLECDYGTVECDYGTAYCE